jgi:hypothetical protein
VQYEVFLDETFVLFPHEKPPNEWVSENVGKGGLNNLNHVVGYWHNYSTPFPPTFVWTITVEI